MSEPRRDVLEVFEGGDHSLLELVDNLLNQGVVLTGDVILGVAGIDLIYLRLSAVLCAADRVLPPHPVSEEESGEPRA
ncbi:MAG TPA: gas vesicle protein [Thermoanaerobaculia bacterium]|nr:gas vesicle protein [Thermoanaerobaculia bacterium]